MTSQDWKPLVAHYEKFAKARKKSLDGLLDESDVRLSPFKDPLRCDLMMQGVLSKAREEAYSAALAWSLGQLELGRVLDILGIQGLKLTGRRWRQSKEWVHETEIEVPQGHEGKGGRLDMTISFQNELVAAIEIKTKEYTQFDTGKHVGYAKWVKAREGRVAPHMVLIGVADLEFDLHGFRFMSWSDVTAGLRRNAQYVIGKREYPIAATYLGFIGAVEQNLLRFGPPSDLPLEAAVRQSDHFRAVLATSRKRGSQE